MNELLLFLKESAKDFRHIGAVAPSSHYLASRMADKAQVGQAKIIVELGAGTGSITKRILEKMHDSAKLIAFERNSLLALRLIESIQDPRLLVINEDISLVEIILRERKINQADVIISGLPLANWKRGVSEAIIRSAERCLVPGGRFVQFQYSLRSKSMLKNIFSYVSISFEPRNLPMAFVYTCLKK